MKKLNTDNKQAIMKILLSICCIVVSITSAQAQGKLELKANVFPIWFSSQAELSGEYLLSERIGIEAGAGYKWQTSKSGYIDTLTGNTIWTRITESRVFNFYASGKYYFHPKHGGDRFFTGVLIHHRFYSTYTRNGEDIEKPKLRTSIGVEPGYKWAIKDRFIVEASTRWYASFPKYPWGRVIELDLLINGKIGYRF